MGDEHAVGAAVASRALSEPRKKTARERFGSKPNPFEKAAGYAVVRGPDFRRIAALPRRTEYADYTRALELALAREPVEPGTCPSQCPCLGTGVMYLRPIQAWALSEFFMMRGGVGWLGVGAGKSLISLLLFTLMAWERGLLLVKAALRDKALNIDAPLLSRHWRLPAFSDTDGRMARSERTVDMNVVVCAYEELSQKSMAEYLDKQRVPDGVVGDEIHMLARPDAGRTKRWKRFHAQHPECELVGMTGSPTHRSLMDYGHLMNHALYDYSPVPHSYMEMKTWADAIDENTPDYARAKPGALWDFCREGETVQDGFRRRMLEAPGVVSSSDFSTSIGLVLRELQPPAPPKEVLEAFALLRNKGQTPDSVKCASALDQSRHARELFLGFFLRWKWPDGKRDTEWMDAKRLWCSYVRKTTQSSHGGKHYDTEAQVAAGVVSGALDGEVEDPRTGQWVNAYEQWVPIRDDRTKKWGGKKEPPKEIVWLSDYMLRFVEQWAEENLGIVWVENILFLEALRSRGHVCYGAGQNEIEYEDGKRSVFSSYAHSTGKNLQMWNRMFFPNPRTSGKAWEQNLGREHRPHCRFWNGKKFEEADEVVADVVLGCRETWWSMERSKLDARYTEATMGQWQRLNRATMDMKTTEEIALARCDAGDPLWAMTGFAKLDAAPTASTASDDEQDGEEVDGEQDESDENDHDN